MKVKKLLASLLSIVLLITGLSWNVLAAESSDSFQFELLSSDGTSKGSFATFDVLYNNETSVTSEDTIKLLSDIEVTPTNLQDRDGFYAGVGVPCSLDLNGHTITVKNDSSISQGLVFGVVAMFESGYSGTIQNGKIVIDFSATDNTPSYGVFVGGENGVTIRNIEIVTTEGNTITSGTTFNFAGTSYNACEQKIENSIIDVGGTAICAFGGETNFTTFNVVSGSYTNLYSNNGNLPDKVSIKNGSSTLTSKPDSVAEDTTVITSANTTAMIVKDGNAYLYDSLSEAVSAVDNGGVVYLLKESEENITISEESNFTLDTDNAEYKGSITAGDGFELTTDENGNYVITPAPEEPEPEESTPSDPAPADPAPVYRDAVTIVIGESAPAPEGGEENPDTGAPVFFGAVIGARAGRA